MKKGRGAIAIATLGFTLTLLLGSTASSGAAPPQASGERAYGPQQELPAVDEPTPVPPRDGSDPAPEPIPAAIGEDVAGGTNEDPGGDEADSDSAEEPEAEASADTSVDIADFLFEPKDITVSVGDTVTWTNLDEAPHDATADDDSFATKLMDEGETDSVTFDEEGTFSYICSIHPPDSGYEDFVGTVEVVAASSGGGEDSGSTDSAAGDIESITPTLDSGSAGASGGGGSTSSGSSSSGSLADTGQNEIVLIAIGACLLAGGLLVRALVEHLAWR